MTGGTTGRDVSNWFFRSVDLLRRAWTDLFTLRGVPGLPACLRYAKSGLPGASGTSLVQPEAVSKPTAKGGGALNTPAGQRSWPRGGQP